MMQLNSVDCQLPVDSSSGSATPTPNKSASKTANSRHAGHIPVATDEKVLASAGFTVVDPHHSLYRCISWALTTTVHGYYSLLREWVCVCVCTLI
jgi:hypothetical protein